MSFPTLRCLRPGAVLLVLAVLAGCGSAPKEIDPTGVDGLVIPTPDPDPTDFVEGVDNRYLPLSARLGVDLHQHLAGG